ncbi:hypothetical protein LEP1GSC073_3779 [Leptospira noguchii str. Cascata]|nr:hypothetical protein LEP1GSC073_3779 [Leptospira noguchii str. Cascata]
MAAPRSVCNLENDCGDEFDSPQVGIFLNLSKAISEIQRSDFFITPGF